MTRRTRTILFSCFVFLFIVIAPLIILYCQGYRFDFETKKITQTGGFYFKTSPTSATIYLDGKKLNKKTDFFFGSVFWQNLLPKKYKARIEKDGYQPWQKTLEVKEKLVTEAKNIILFPQKLNFQTLSQIVEEFWPLPDGKRIILKKSSLPDQTLKTNNWRLVMYDIQKNVQSLFLEETTLGKKALPTGRQESADIISITPSSDSKKILITTSIGEKIQNFVVELNGQTPTNPISLNFLEEGVENFNFNLTNSQKLFFINGGSLFEADLIKKETSKNPILENAVSYNQFDNNLYFLQSTPPAKKGGQSLGFIYKTDLSGKIIEKINETPVLLKPETDYKIIIFLPNIFLQEGSTLYLFNPDSKAFEKFFEPIKNLKISSDSKKIAYFSEKSSASSDNDLWLLYVKDIDNQPQKKAGDIAFLTQLPNTIKDIFWLNSDYLILNAGDEIKIVETDDRDKIQTWDIGKFTNPEIFFNEADKKLYILSEGNLYSSENLLK